VNEVVAKSTFVGSAGPISYPSLREAIPTWVRVALLSFGGPAGQIAVMHRIIVDEKRWVSEERFLHALNYCMLLPGPEAQQLATYIGWLMHKTPGGLLAGGLFILPGIICIMVLSYVYALWGRVPIVTAFFFGLKAAVLAIVIEAVVRIGKRALKSRSLMALAVAAFVAIFFFAVPFPVIIFAAVLLGLTGVVHPIPLSHRPVEGASSPVQQSLIDEATPEHAKATIGRTARVAAVWLALWLTPVIGFLILFGPQDVFSQIAVFFSKMAMVTIGGAYAVLACVAQQAVQHYGWLTRREMLDGLGMAETTPGPLIMVLQFVGFMAAYRNPGTHSARGNHGRIAGNLGHVHPLLPLDICWRALHRKAAQRRQIERSALSRAWQQQPEHRRSKGAESSAPDHRPQGVAYVSGVDLIFVSNGHNPLGTSSHRTPRRGRDMDIARNAACAPIPPSRARTPRGGGGRRPARAWSCS
jgi:putative chromate ion transporter